MDNTPPRNRLIALYTALAVVTLLALKPAFDEYFDHMHQRFVAEGIAHGFVEATVLGEPPADVARAARRAVGAHSDDLQRCYDERLGERPALTGTLQTTVRAANGVVSVDVGEDRLGDEPLARCARTTLESIDASALPSQPVRVGLSFAPTEADLRKLTWREALDSAPTPLREAMARLERQGRLAADPRIRPTNEGEMNLDALRGWVQLPQEVHGPQAPTPAPEPATEGTVMPAAEGAAPTEGAQPTEPGAPTAGQPAGAQPAAPPSANEGATPARPARPAAQPGAPGARRAPAAAPAEPAAAEPTE